MTFIQRHGHLEKIFQIFELSRSPPLVPRDAKVQDVTKQDSSLTVEHNFTVPGALEFLKD